MRLAIITCSHAISGAPNNFQKNIFPFQLTPMTLLIKPNDSVYSEFSSPGYWQLAPTWDQLYHAQENTVNKNEKSFRTIFRMVAELIWSVHFLSLGWLDCGVWNERLWTWFSSIHVSSGYTLMSTGCSRKKSFNIDIFRSFFLMNLFRETIGLLPVNENIQNGTQGNTKNSLEIG